MILLTYVDDCIIVGPSMVETDAFTQSMKNLPERFVLTDKGDINKFLCIEITHIDENRFKSPQPFSIERIIYLINIDINYYVMDTNSKSTPVDKPVLQKDLSVKQRKQAWNYRKLVGMLNYFQGNSCPEMSMPVYQTTCTPIMKALYTVQTYQRV